MRQYLFASGIFAKFYFWYLANLSKLINFHSPWNLKFALFKKEME